MAQRVLDGARSVVGRDSAKLLVSNRVDFEKDVLSWSDAVVVGSPVYMANPHPKILEMLTFPKTFLAKWVLLLRVEEESPAAKSMSSLRF